MSTLRRLFFRVGLLLATALAIAVVVAVFRRPEVSPEARWAAVAGALAVITGVLAAWAAVRLVEFEEDERRPDVVVRFDVESLYSMILLSVENHGRSVALDVRLSWDQAPIRFEEGTPLEALAIVSLHPGERLTRHLGGSWLLMKHSPYPDTVGRVTYRDHGGKEFVTDVRLSLEARRGELVATQEGPRTHHELQKLPELLKRLERQVEGVRQAVEAMSPPGDRGS